MRRGGRRKDRRVHGNGVLGARGQNVVFGFRTFLLLPLASVAFPQAA